MGLPFESLKAKYFRRLSDLEENRRSQVRARRRNTFAVKAKCMEVLLTAVKRDMVPQLKRT